MQKLAALSLLIIAMFLAPAPKVSAQTGTPPPEVSPYDIINAYNSRRTALGYKALTVNSILMNTAQQTAEIMAANQMTGHIGNVRGRVRDAGYRAGDTAWATENFLLGPLSLQEIMLAWGDDTHMIPAINPNYCDIGVGIAKSGDVVYYVLHAAYSDYHACGDYKSPTPGKGTPSATSGTAVDPLSQWIMPVETVTPQSNGWAIHTVKQGQTLWSIAMAYGAKVVAIVNANALSPDDPLIYTGQKLFIPVTITPATPTPENTPSPQVTPALPSSPTVQAGLVRQVRLDQSTSTAQTPGRKEPAPVDRTIAVSLVAAFGLGCALIMLGIVLKK